MPALKMLRAPHNGRQVLGKVVVDLRSCNIGGFPTLTQASYPIDATGNTKAPTSHPFSLETRFCCGKQWRRRGPQRRDRVPNPARPDLNAYNSTKAVSSRPKSTGKRVLQLLVCQIVELFWNYCEENDASGFSGLRSFYGK